MLDETLSRVSPSQLTLWLNCSQAWNYQYIDQYRKKVVSTQDYFAKGTLFHEKMHVYYHALQNSNHKPGAEFLQQYMKSNMKRSLDDMTYSNIEVLHAVDTMLERYVRVQSPSIDAGITILDIEKMLEIEVELPSGRRIILNGIADLIYKDRMGRVHIRDHKTGQNAGVWKDTKLPLNMQLLFYATVYYKLYGVPCTAEINFINAYVYKNKQPTKDECFKLLPVQYSEQQLINFWNYLLSVTDRMLSSAPINNYSTDCPSCQYFLLCESDLKGLDSKVVLSTKYEKVQRSYATHLTTGNQEATDKDASGDTNSKFSVPKFS